MTATTYNGRDYSKVFDAAYIIAGIKSALWDTYRAIIESWNRAAGLKRWFDESRG